MNLSYGACTRAGLSRPPVNHAQGQNPKRAATPEEIRQIYDLVRRGLDDGALGIGMGIAYVPLATRAEILELFGLAAQRKTAVYVHIRNGGPVEPGVIDALQEVIALLKGRDLGIDMQFTNYRSG